MDFTDEGAKQELMEEAKPAGRETGGEEKNIKEEAKPAGREPGGEEKDTEEETKPAGREPGGEEKKTKEDTKPAGREPGGEQKKEPDYKSENAKLSKDVQALRNQIGFLMRKLNEPPKTAQAGEKPQEKEKEPTPEEKEAAAEAEKILKDPAIRAAIPKLFEEMYGQEFRQLKQFAEQAGQERISGAATRAQTANAKVLDDVKKEHPDAEQILASEEYWQWFAGQPRWLQMAGMGPRYDQAGNLVYPGGGVKGGLMILNMYKDHVAKNGGGQEEKKKEEEEEKKKQEELKLAGGIGAGGAGLPAAGKGAPEGQSEFVKELLRE